MVVSSSLPRVSVHPLLIIIHPNIRWSREECQQRSPLTPRVKALQWSCDHPPPPSSLSSPQGDLRGWRAVMEILWTVFLFMEAAMPGWATLGARCVARRNKANYLRRTMGGGGQ